MSTAATAATGPTPQLAPRRLAWRKPSILPGFRISLTVTLIWLGVIVIAPLGVMLWFTAQLGWSRFIALILRPRVLGDLWVSLSTAFLASMVNAVFGLLIAWVLTRYRFPGRRLADALVDLPFALPTAVAGIALSTLYAPQWLGRPGAGAAGRARSPFIPPASSMAMMFISLPFIVRTVQPVIEDLELEQEEAAGHDGCHRAADFPAHHPAADPALPAHRLRAGAGALHRRVRLDHLHRRQQADGLRNRCRC